MQLGQVAGTTWPRKTFVREARKAGIQGSVGQNGIVQASTSAEPVSSRENRRTA